MSKHVSLTILFEGSNLNYGEGFGNIQSLKKVSSKGKSYSYISRQALRYDVVRIMNEEFGVALTPIGKDGKVIQFEKDAHIEDFPEIDLFGYMKTGSNANKGNQEIRKGIVRLTDAVSIEPYNNDMDFGNNMGLARRKAGEDNGLFQSEIHKAFYSYTITIDLEKVGVDDNTDTRLSKSEKEKRLHLLFDSIKILYRDIKGKRENLAPCFVIGGVFSSGNPFFYNRVTLDFQKDRILLNTKMINDVLKTTINDKEIKESAHIGFISGMFSNIDELEMKNKSGVEEFFKELKKEISESFKG